jgi:hypothetical protein
MTISRQRWVVRFTIARPIPQLKRREIVPMLRTIILQRSQDRRWLTGIRLVVPMLMLSMLLVACADIGSDDEVTTAQTVTPISIVSGDPPQASPAPSTPVASPPTGEPSTVGELASLVESAWTSVTSYRATSISSSSGGVLVDPLASPVIGSPVAASPNAIPDDGSVAIDEVVMPDLRHQIVREAGVESEFIAAKGMVYVRGAYARVYIDPIVDPSAWIALDPAQIPPESPIGIFVERFAGPEAFASPFANLQASTLALPLRPAGETTVDGRTCQSYNVVRTTQTGERVDINLAIDERNLPCYQETVAGGTVNRTTYGDFNADIAIAPPANALPSPFGGAAGSPVASPGA